MTRLGFTKKVVRRVRGSIFEFNFRIRGCLELIPIILTLKL